jgi:hypothetical protein
MTPRWRVTLIAANCLVFLFQQSLDPDELELFLSQFALIPVRYSELVPGESDLVPEISCLFSQ